ncbi:hypothetical protein ASPWEDRAFT_35510 [Aspergillus wentii DTO 134E9]|uniref:Amidase domain-containing protein n=1 Tax=Aspergillus wentii DTO 134E9 TaxID=1073089 RepID=A0A1L9S423_ASPWE|nr:uncharacterized protein ASPWEDRAFT_35510 [Aspergillus wentii DTO 134E9]OJJ41891.1 hypothetical protein ASPWEDRAFT_35510 [Aspergillus wentii DTO 134E9]
MYSILVNAAMVLPALSCCPSHPRVALQSSLEPHGQCLQPKVTPLDVGDDGVYAQQRLDYLLGEPYGNTTCLVSVFNVNAGDTVNMQFLHEKVNIYLKDDVFRREFLQGILFQGAKENEVTFNVDLQQLHRQWGTTWHCFLPDSNTNLHPGPYSAIQGELYDVRRIYSDDSLAFVRVTWHPRGSEYGLTQLHLAGDRYRSLGIAVPSRLHSLDPSHRLPLNGVRIAVKDNFDIAGLRTSVGSLPYYQLYPPKSQTADAVSRLISLGAQVIGKLAMSAFALQEHPMQSVDYQAPINPRADGYQIPGGSSSGGGAAIASYDWLDLALVSDTTGSARIPALLNGCFGLRPTPGLISNAGCKGVYPAFDTPALLGRDLTLFDRFLSAWNTTSRPLITSSTRPRVLYPKDFLPTNNQEQLKILDTFAERLSLALGSELEHMSIAEAWAEDSPEGDGNLDTYLFNVCIHDTPWPRWLQI